MVLVGVLLFYSCSESADVLEAPRLFRPVLSAPLTATDNTIKVSMANLADAVSYRVEISKDNFVTSKVYETTSSIFVIKDLIWNKTYQVRATSIASDPTHNSYLADLGSVKTDRFPSILAIPQPTDIIDIGLNVRWTTGVGAVVTDVKFFNPIDEELLNPLLSYTTTTTEQTTGLKAVKTLMPATQYTVAIYSGTTLRGYETFTTKPALTVSGTPIDLRNVPVTPTSLNDAFAAATNGQTIILDGDSTYSFNGNITLDKSIVLKSGYSLSTGGAILDMNNQFEVGGSGTYSVVFDGINFKGSAAMNKYVINAGTSSTATITDLKFLNCIIDGFRDLIRIRLAWGSGSLGTLTIDNSKVSTFGNAGMILADSGAVTAPINNIVLTNSTFYNIQKLIYLRSTNASTCAVKISDCTFYEASKTAAMIEATTTGASISSLQISNSIFGRGISSGAVVVSPATVYDYALTKNVSATPVLGNNYYTNDFNFLAPIPSPISLFAGDAQTLWVDPVNANFRIKATSFAGKSTAGDPRWRL